MILSNNNTFSDDMKGILDNKELYQNDGNNLNSDVNLLGKIISSESLSTMSAASNATNLAINTNMDQETKKGRFKIKNTVSCLILNNSLYILLDKSDDTICT